MPLDPRLAKLLRFFLVGIGALTVVSAIVEIVAAVRLLEPSDAEALGMSRNFVIGMNSCQGLVGVVLMYFGLRRKR